MEQFFPLSWESSVYGESPGKQKRGKIVLPPHLGVSVCGVLEFSFFG